MAMIPCCGRSFPSSRPQNGCVMSMQPVPWPEPDPQVAAAIKAMYGSRKTERPLAVEVRDRLGQWLADEDFTAAFAAATSLRLGTGPRLRGGHRREDQVPRPGPSCPSRI